MLPAFRGEARDAANFPTGQRAAPHNKQYLAQNVSSAEAGGPSFITIPLCG